MGREEPFIPPPPPSPYKVIDPNENVPKWDVSRVVFGLPHNTEGFTKLGQQPASDDHPDWRGIVKNKSIIMDTPKLERLGQPRDPKYFYFDTPDYADPFKKIWWSFKMSLGVGASLAGIAGAYMQPGFTIASHFYLFRRFALPTLIAGTVAGTAVPVLALLRGKKDDRYNYFFGALAGTASVAYDCHARFARTALFWVPVMVLTKWSVENNGHLTPMINLRYGNYSNYGSSADHGFFSGDLRFGVRSSHGDPGRDPTNY